jgi:hypothetical protein
VKLFRDLTPEEGAEVATFQKWARDHYQVYKPIDGVWHPVVQAECVRMNVETGYWPLCPNPREPEGR